MVLLEIGRWKLLMLLEVGKWWWYLMLLEVGRWWWW